MLNSYKYSIPAKTFLLGEYIALEGGPVLIACTKPEFTLKIQASSSLELVNIHPDSPAGKLINDNAKYFAKNKIIFIDPYVGAGGLGASTAQFLGVYRALNQLIAPEKILKSYYKYSWNGVGFRPSGADLIAQTQANICFYHKNYSELEQLAWPFANLNFLLIRTGNKIATHEHLRNLNKLPTAPLSDLVIQATQALLNKDSDKFINAINHYANYIAKNNLVLEPTLKMLDLFKQHPACLAAKGCGALGADVILLIIDKNKRDDFTNVIASEMDLML